MGFSPVRCRRVPLCTRGCRPEACRPHGFEFVLQLRSREEIRVRQGRVVGIIVLPSALLVDHSKVGLVERWAFCAGRVRRPKVRISGTFAARRDARQVLRFFLAGTLPSYRCR